MDFGFDLEENAMDSLVHSVEHFLDPDIDKKDRNLKNAVLHIFHALELFLKARLAMAHPVLIYSKPEQALLPDPHTVEFGTLLGRLDAVGAKISKDDRDSLEALRKHRNSIEHHRIKTDRKSIEDYIGRTMRFLEDFLDVEMNISLRDQLDEATYKALSSAVHSYEKRIELALEELERHVPGGKDGLGHEQLWCDNCGERTVLVPDSTCETGFAHCFFCDTKYIIKTCDRCEKTVLFEDTPFSYLDIKESGVLCDECRRELSEH
ncbi:hypothetical protein [Corallococcus exiguus]|uniref:hypothetical protein n=1 Tax=Corallococcus exiguus TaxID=83462 RepID=UPI001470ED73|nr:hypothetical protein [Corallococcus exiguus]NNB85375.1 hypothetical protein [Corallococcus exiguus]